ncbi:hypothetical protein [Butyrivibrio sp. JL13D10]|uniref:hypothetical protein n=1 Tax=Butyrivibrio sp. JL13D10 TaxID=3236815 RepID=UPI0038B4210B
MSMKGMASAGVGAELEEIVEGNNAANDDRVSEVEGQTSASNGEASEVNDQNSEGENSTSEADSQTSEVEGQASEVDSQASKAEGQASEADSQTSKIGGQSSEADSQTSEVEGQASEAEESVNGTNSDSMNSLPVSLSCAFILPAGFKASDTPGVFVNKHYPLESANITYNVHLIPQQKALTNAEKAEGKADDEGGVEFSYNELTGDRYETMQRNSFESLYGENINYNLESFENVEIDGFPGYKIIQSYTLEGAQTIHQTSFIMLSKNKVYTIVFSRAEDDDFDAAFSESMATIHMK